MRCHFAKLNSFKHPLFVKFLGLFFDVRTGIKGDVELWFRERDAVNRRRMLRRLQRIIHNHRSVV